MAAGAVVCHVVIVLIGLALVGSGWWLLSPATLAPRQCALLEARTQTCHGLGACVAVRYYGNPLGTDDWEVVPTIPDMHDGGGTCSPSLKYVCCAYEFVGGNFSARAMEHLRKRSSVTCYPRPLDRGTHYALCDNYDARLLGWLLVGFGALFVLIGAVLIFGDAVEGLISCACSVLCGVCCSTEQRYVPVRGKEMQSV